jgi:cytochrome c biogenesis protein CcmG, thiol:disulfide interchange protein DsbE
MTSSDEVTRQVAHDAPRDPTGEPAGRNRRTLVLIPLVLFCGLAALFFVRLGAGDASRIPSALIGREAPPTDLPAVAGLERDGKPIPGITAADFHNAVTVLNVWASWCVPCHDEAPLLMRLARDSRIRVVGINYKDQADNARRFLGRYGNPTPMDARRSSGASMACRRPSWSAATARSPTSSWGPLRPRTSSAS